jgi:amphi-Trp domain-containing protein
MSDTDDFSYSVHCERSQVADHLEILAKLFREGKLQFAADDKLISLNPADGVKLKIKAKNKLDKNKGELKIDISWKERISSERTRINA